MHILLQADVWPIGRSNLLEFNFPPELEKFIHEVKNVFLFQSQPNKF